MTSDSTPVFALEKEALKTEIETGLQVGVSRWKSITTPGTCSSNTARWPMQSRSRSLT